ncbi:MAG: glycine zipper 2TM domain-containing protein [Bergeyella sp.]|nr:glycine zipper 2TM domain-containing protein [Bergeyella sp.]
MKMFKTGFFIAVSLSVVLTVSSCEAVQNANSQQKGTAIGTTAGAVLGGILGNNVGKGGNGALGAILGGVVGGVAGNVIGRKMDKQAKEIKETLPGAEVERVGDGLKVTLKENIVKFAFDSANLLPDAKTNIDKLATVLTNNPDTRIYIYGYTDNKGKAAYNLKLSERRADAVKTYLVSKGVAASRIQTKGLGMADPIASNETDAGRAENRRVEFGIVANEKMKKEAEKIK